MIKNIFDIADLPKYLIVISLSISTALQFWNSYKQKELESTISKQLKGELSANAREISKLRTDIKTAQSKMLSYDDMQNRTEEIIQSIGESSQGLQKHLDSTDAKIISYQKRFSRIESRLENGISKISGKVDRKAPPPKPTKEWKGISENDFLTCFHHYDPVKCPEISYSWNTSEQNKGKPIAGFKTDNLWLSKAGNIDLNLAFRVDVITYSEDQSKLGSGAVKNQGIYVKAGYLTQEGEFKTIAEDKLIEGDPNLDPKFFYVPTVPYGHSKKYGLFEPAYYVGLALLPMEEYDIGLIGGGSFVNVLDAKLRLGGIAYISNSYFGVGASLSYHPKIGGKYLNFAPNISYLFSAERNNLSLGMLFQVW